MKAYKRTMPARFISNFIWHETRLFAICRNVLRFSKINVLDFVSNVNMTQVVIIPEACHNLKNSACRVFDLRTLAHCSHPNDNDVACHLTEVSSCEAHSLSSFPPFSSIIVTMWNDVRSRGLFTADCSHAGCHRNVTVVTVQQTVLTIADSIVKTSFRQGILDYGLQ